MSHLLKFSISQYAEQREPFLPIIKTHGKNIHFFKIKKIIRQVLTPAAYIFGTQNKTLVNQINKTRHKISFTLIPKEHMKIKIITILKNAFRKVASITHP